MRLLYDLGILLMNAGLRMAAPFNPKARLWVRGRKDIFRRMAEVVGPRLHGFTPPRSGSSSRDAR